MVCILLLMLLLHIIDDFVMQSAFLCNGKQKEWWYTVGAFNDDNGNYNWRKFEKLIKERDKHYEELEYAQYLRLKEKFENKE